MRGHFPMVLGEKSTNAELANLLGHKFTHGDGRVFKLAKASATIGASTSAAVYANGKALKWTDDAANTVEGGAANTDPVCGVVPDEGPITLASGDYFLMQIAGDFTGRVGSAGSDQVDAGEYVFCSTDADLGKLDDGGTTFTNQVTFAKALTTSSTADAQVVCRIVGELTG